MKVENGQVAVCQAMAGGIYPLPGGDRFATVRAAQAWVRGEGLKALEEAEADTVVVIVKVERVARVTVTRQTGLAFEGTDEQAVAGDAAQA